MLAHNFVQPTLINNILLMLCLIVVRYSTAYQCSIEDLDQLQEMSKELSTISCSVAKSYMRNKVTPILLLCSNDMSHLSDRVRPDWPSVDAFNKVVQILSIPSKFYSSRLNSFTWNLRPRSVQISEDCEKCNSTFSNTHFYKYNMNVEHPSISSAESRRIF